MRGESGYLVASIVIAASSVREASLRVVKWRELGAMDGARMGHVFT